MVSVISAVSAQTPTSGSSATVHRRLTNSRPPNLTLQLDGTVGSWSDHRIEGDVQSPLTADGREFRRHSEWDDRVAPGKDPFAQSDGALPGYGERLHTGEWF